MCSPPTVGPEASSQSLYTEVGSLIGTLEYMSPEQAKLNNLHIDTRSDDYALDRKGTSLVHFLRAPVLGTGRGVL